MGKIGQHITGFAILLACLGAGGWLAGMLPLPLPGALIGMGLLAALLGLHRGWLARASAAAGEILLRRYALFFVPAGVGIMAGAGALRAAWPAVAAALVISSLLSLAVTALTMRACLSWRQTRARRRGAMKA